MSLQHEQYSCVADIPQLHKNNKHVEIGVEIQIAEI